MRLFASDVLAALLAEEATERTFLIQLDFSGGAIYLSTGTRDLDWDGQTWEAVGGNLQIGGIEESGDLKGQGIDLTLSGIDTTIVGTLLSNEYRGRSIQVWQVILDPVTGLVLDGINLFDGLQLDSYQIEEKIDRSRALTATIRTRGRHRLSTNEFRGIRANLHSHQTHFVGDTFWRHVVGLSNRKLFWGMQPTRIGGSGGTGFGDGEDDGNDDRFLPGPLG
jgi:hypothetical protein